MKMAAKEIELLSTRGLQISSHLKKGSKAPNMPIDWST